MADAGREGTEFETAKLEKAAASSAFSGLKSFISGGFGGVCCVLVGTLLEHTQLLMYKDIPLIW